MAQVQSAKIGVIFDTGRRPWVTGQLTDSSNPGDVEGTATKPANAVGGADAASGSGTTPSEVLITATELAVAGASVAQVAAQSVSGSAAVVSSAPVSSGTAKVEVSAGSRQVSVSGRKLNSHVDGVDKKSSDKSSADTLPSVIKSVEATTQAAAKPVQPQSDFSPILTTGSATHGQPMQPVAPSSLMESPAGTAPNAGVPGGREAASSPAAGSTTRAAGELATPALTGAQLLHTMHQSEMRLGINSAEFGNISISTSLTRQSLSAQISLDHGELGRALAVHLPAMEAKLGSSFGLPTRIELRDASQASGGDAHRSSNDSRQQQSFGSRGKLNLSAAAAPIGAGGLPWSTPTPAIAGARLDINI